MIIKSMSRKSATFSQLHDYMNKSRVLGDAISWNMPSFYNRNMLLNEFNLNASLLPQRSNGNILYHEIISISYQNNLPLESQIKALQDLTYKYLEKRAPRQIGYGRMHIEKGHLHFHVMVSANELNSPTRSFLYKKDFRSIQVECERYIRAKYPELNQPLLIDIETKQLNTVKELISDRLRHLLTTPRTSDLQTHLKEHGFEVYQRGSKLGVIYGGKKYRLQSLGLEPLFIESQKLSYHKTKKANRLKELNKLHQYYQQVDKDLDSPEI